MKNDDILTPDQLRERVTQLRRDVRSARAAAERAAQHADALMGFILINQSAGWLALADSSLTEAAVKLRTAGDGAKDTEE